MSDVLFGGPDDAATRGPHWKPGPARVLVTVKASPNPSAHHGETVCVAGIRIDHEFPGWIRLYPINFRDLEDGKAFNKYDIVEVNVSPPTQDSRLESWRPDRESLRIVKHLPPWDARRPLVEPYIRGTMCQFHRLAKADPNAQSLALVRPSEVLDLKVERHQGWSPEEQAKIDAYANQMSLFGEDRKRLRAPRFTARYQYRCQDHSCRGHEQTLLDWEFTAMQHNHFRWTDERSTIDELRAKFLDQLCSPDRDVAFYVGNQAKRRTAFSILGVWWPPRT